MAAAAIAAKAAINRKIAKQKKADLAAALAAGLDPRQPTEPIGWLCSKTP